MYKQLKNHKKLIEKEIKSLEPDKNHGSKEELRARAEKVYHYHQDMTRNFQHERFIHLIVTLFFGMLFIASAVMFLYLALQATSYTISVIATFTIFVLLAVTEMCYIIHYYHLENGTQSLYKLSKQLEKIIES